MRALFELFLAICLLRKGPQDVPASPVLLRLTLLSYGLSGVLIQLQLLDVDLASSLVLTVLNIVLLTGFAYSVLVWRHYPQRFMQTLTALLGTGTLLRLLALLLLLMDQETTPADTSGWFRLLWQGPFVWSIFVMAHILRHAGSTSLAMGVVYTLIYLFLSSMTISWIASSGLQPVS